MGDDSITGSATNNFIFGFNGNDALIGGIGDDIIFGGDGNDTITGGAGADALTGGDGADTFNVTEGADTITDLALNNNADIVTNAATGSVDATLAGNWTATSATSNAAANTAFTVRADGTESVDLTLASVSGALNGYSVVSTGTGAVTGSAQADLLTNTSGSATFTGLAGADTFTSTSDTMIITDLGQGGEVDIVTNAAGATVSATATGTFTASAATVNRAANTAFTVNVASLGDVDLSAAGTVNGYRVLSTGTSAVTGSAQADLLTNASSNATFTGLAGADTFTAMGETMTITDLGNGADVLIVIGTALTNATVVSNYVAAVTNSNTSIGAVTLTGNFNMDMDLAVGNAGYSLVGGAGDNTLIGSDFNDTIAGGAGADVLTGGLGADTFNVDDGVDAITDLGVGGADVVVVSKGATANASVTNTTGYTATGASSNAGNLNVTLSAAVLDNQTVSFANLIDGGVNLTGNAEDNILIGSAQADTISGSSGDDLITGGEGADSLTGGLGADTFVYMAVAHSAASIAANTIVTFDTITDFDSSDFIDISDINTVLTGGAAATGVTVNTVTYGALGSNPINNFSDFVAPLNRMQASAPGGKGANTGIQAFFIDLAGNGGTLGTGKYLMINNNDGQLNSNDVMIAWTGIRPESADFILA
jgi:Ca2+-binding RTX toxin-like protein